MGIMYSNPASNFEEQGVGARCLRQDEKATGEAK